MNRKSKIIVDSLFNSKEFNDIFNRIMPNNFIDDLKMEVISIICNLSDAKLLKIYNDSALLYYCKKIAHYSVSNSGPMIKKYNPRKVNVSQPVYNVDDYFEMKQDEIKCLAEDKLLKEIKRPDEQFGCEKVLMQLYAKYGNYRAVAKVAGVSLKTVHVRLNRGYTLMRYRLNYTL